MNILKKLFLLVWISAFLVTVKCADFYGYGVIPHLAYGGDYWRTILIITNKSKTQPSLTSIDFFESNGNNASLTFLGSNGTTYTANNNLGVRLPPLTSIRLETINMPTTLKTGWAKFYSVEGEADVFVVFRAKFPPSMNRADYESVVFPEIGYVHEVLVPFDNRNGFGTALALVNFGDNTNTFTITIRNVNGDVLGTYTETMLDKTQMAYQTADRWSATVGAAGSIHIRGEYSSFAALTLLFNPSLSMTSSTSVTVK